MAEASFCTPITYLAVPSAERLTESSVMRRYRGVVLVTLAAVGPALSERMRRLSAALSQGMGLKTLFVEAKSMKAGAASRLREPSGTVRFRFVSGGTLGRRSSVLLASNSSCSLALLR